MAHILVLDDVAAAVEAVAKILEKRGHKISGFTEEEEALRYLRSHPVDLAVLDIKLKVRDGVDILAEMKALRPEMKAIMLTGYPSHESVEKSTRLGADAYCVKPIDRQDLESRVDEVLGFRAKNIEGSSPVPVT